MTIFGNDKPRWVHGLFVMKKKGVPNNRLHLTVVPLRYTPAGEPKRCAKETKWIIQR